MFSNNTSLQEINLNRCNACWSDRKTAAFLCSITNDGILARQIKTQLTNMERRRTDAGSALCERRKRAVEVTFKCSQETS